MKTFLLICGISAMSFIPLAAQKVSMAKGRLIDFTLVKGGETNNFNIGNNRFFITEKFENAVMNFTQNSFDESGDALANGKLEIPVGEFKNSFSIRDVVAFAGKEYAFVENMDKTTSMNTLTAREVDNYGKVSGDEKKVMSFAFKKIMNSGFHFIAVSPGHTKLAVMGNLPFEKELPGKCKIAVFDQQMKLVKESEMDLPGEDTRNKTLSLEVADDGTVYIIKRTTTKNGEIALTVYQGAENGAAMKEYVIDPGAPVYPTSYMHTVNPKGELIVAGVYYKRVTLSTGEQLMNGVFYYTNRNKSENVFKTAELAKPVENLVIRKILLSGSTVFLCTEQFKSVRDPQPTGTTTIVDNYTYTHKSSFVIGLGDDGTKKFQLELAKEGVSRNMDQHDHVAFFVCKGKLTVLYNDDTKKYIPGGYGKTPVLVTISPEGLMTAPLVFKDNLKLDHTLYPCYAVQASDTKLCLIAGGGDKGMMVTLTLE